MPEVSPSRLKLETVTKGGSATRSRWKMVDRVCMWERPCWVAVSQEPCPEWTDPERAVLMMCAVGRIAGVGSVCRLDMVSLCYFSLRRCSYL